MKFQQLIQSDALSLLSHLPDDLASLIYIDPPWNNTHTNEPRETEISELYLYTALHSKSILTSKGVLVWHTSPGLVGCVRNILDSIFSTNRFTSEIILKYRLSFPSSRTPRSNHTSLLIYTKTDNFKYVAPTGDVNNGRYTKEDATGRAFILSDITTPFSRPSLSFSWRGSVPPPNRSWRFTLEKLEELYTQGRIEVSAGRQPRLKRYLDEAHAPEIGSVWDDISISPTERQFSVERFPTQQPLMVFERLISAFTDVDDVIIDPFCGSGTTLVAAQMLKRRWLGADISSDAIRIASARLQSIDPALNVLPVESSASFHGHTYRKIADLLKMVSPPPNILLSDIHALVNSAESDVLEFKETLSLCQKEQMKKPYVELAVLKTIGAFLNTKGGTLLVGVSDKNKVLGISAEIDKLYNGSRDKFLLHFQNMLKENIGPKFYPFIGEAIVTVDSTPIFRVDVLPASDPCFVGRGRDEKFYVRRN